MWRSCFKRYSISSVSRVLAATSTVSYFVHQNYDCGRNDNESYMVVKLSNCTFENILEKYARFWLDTSSCSGFWLASGWSPKTNATETLGLVSLRDAGKPFPPASTESFNKPNTAYNGKDEPLTRYSIADAAAKAAPAVVHITVTLGDMGFFTGQGAGSGVIIDPDGTILTNAHVVAGYGNVVYKGKVKVSMQDGRTFDGEVVSYDLSSDIAVVKIKSKTPLPAAALGSSQKLRPGEWIIALGSPLHLQNSVTVGVISCVERKGSEIGLRGVHGGYIQTDAAINQGNSGGPLINLDGEVIGINTMKAFAADGVSFAIPIDTAVKVMEQLQRHGRVIRPWLGIKMHELNEHVLSQLKEQDPSFPDVSQGVLVPQVIPGSPAERAGIRAGDVIVQFDDISISKASQIVDRLGDKVGVSFKVTVKRRYNREITLTVTSEEARAHS